MSGNGYDDVESLKQEIEELKHSCNSNYAVYIRRLERKKTKIKELESFVREITSENERLAAEAAEMEGGIMQVECTYISVHFHHVFQDTKSSFKIVGISWNSWRAFNVKSF